MLSINDLSSEFDPSWGWQRNPSLSFDPRTRLEMFTQYAEQVKDHYLETGDWSLAKAQAAGQLKRTWGVTNINGSGGVTGGGVVMQYPPERAPAYAGMSSEEIATQALDAIKAERGEDVERSTLRLMPLPGVTAQAYKSGQPVPYMLMWSDKDGVVHMLNPGRAFVADPTITSEQRRVQFEERRTRASEPMPEVIAP